MSTQAVSLKVVASLPVDCRFWMEDDGWNGQCDRFSVYVRAGNFEEAKRKMESALEAHITAVLNRHDQTKAASEQAA